MSTAPPLREQTDWKVHAALLFVQVTFGAFHVFGKGLLSQLPPLAVVASRSLVSMPLLLLLALRVDKTVPPARDIARFAVLGFLGIFANQLLYVFGLQLTSAINAAIIMPSIPVCVALIAWATGTERMTRAKALGVSLAVAGALAILDPSRLAHASGSLLGNALLLGNCLVYALYLVLQRDLLLRYHPLTVVSWAFGFGGLGIVAVSAPTLARTDFSHLTTGGWVALAYIAVIPSGVNYALNSWAMVRSSPALVATYTTLQPVAAAVLAVLILGEHATWQEALGFGLIAAGLMCVSRKPKTP
jgi:drug/metabolite transporter (DMT)-like permease